MIKHLYKCGSLCFIFFILELYCVANAQNVARFDDDADDDKDCISEDVSDWDYQLIQLMDIDPEGIVANYSTVNIKELKKVVFPDAMAKYFRITYVESTKIIAFELLRTFTRDYERTENLTQFTILAEFLCESTKYKNLSFVVNITDTNNNSPQFLPDPPYSYTILLPAGEGTPIIPLYGEFSARDNDLTNYAIDFRIEDNPYFNISTGRQSNHKKIIYFATIIAKKPLMDLPNPLTLNISATDVDLTGEERRTVRSRVTFISEVSLIFPTAPKFPKAFYKGYLQDKEVKMDPIQFIQENNKSVKFSLEGEMSEYFTYEVIEDSIQIIFNKTTSPSIKMDIDYFLFSLEATNEYFQSGNTAIFIENIRDNLGSINFNPVYFSNYYFDNDTVSPDITIENMNCDFTVVVGGDYEDYFEANCVNSQLIKLTTLKNLPKEIIKENEFISLRLFAENNQRSGSTTVVLNLVIPHLEMDPLTIIEIEEEREYVSLLQLPDRDCKYNEIISSWPEEAITWFDIDTNTGTLRSQKIDREHSALAFMHVSQLQLQLSVQCPYDKKYASHKDITKYNDTSEVDIRRWIYTRQFDHSLNYQWVNIIVKDINDHPPIFENESPLRLWYPVDSLAQIIRPHNLVTIKANDADIGVNSKVKYTSRSEKFSVHPESGVVYPTGDIFPPNSQMEITFSIRAADGDGQGIHKTDIDCVVKPLTETNIVVITINDDIAEDPSKLLKEISDRISCDIILISSTVLPKNEISYYNNEHFTSDKTKSDKKTSLVMFVYALDENKELLNGSSIESLINKENLTDTLTVNSLSPSKLHFPECNKEDLTIAVSVLGSIIIMVFVGILIAAFCLKGYRLQTRREHQHFPASPPAYFSEPSGKNTQTHK